MTNNGNDVKAQEVRARAHTHRGILNKKKASVPLHGLPAQAQN